MAGAEKLVVIRKRPALLRRNLGKVFPESQHTEAVFQTSPRLYHVTLAAKLGRVTITPVVLVLKV